LPDVEKQVVVVIHHWSSEAQTSANSQTLGHSQRNVRSLNLDIS
jgi:hypothetical protein